MALMTYREHKAARAALVERVNAYFREHPEATRLPPDLESKSIAFDLDCNRKTGVWF